MPEMPSPTANSMPQANATAELYLEADRDFEAFWERLARERITWRTPFRRTLEWDLPFAKWFTGGTLNVSENCLDRHRTNGRKTKAAIIWEGEPGEKRVLTYQQLYREVCAFANVLKRNGAKKGDRIIIYMPMVPEAAIAMLGIHGVPAWEVGAIAARAGDAPQAVVD